MAYTSSGELSVGSSYTLGNYVFSLTATPDPGEGTTGVNVRCDKGDERARAASEVYGTVESWSVEANETVASVYLRSKTSPPDTSPYTLPIQTGGSASYYRTYNVRIHWKISIGGNAVAISPGRGLEYIGASTVPNHELVIGTETRSSDGQSTPITVDATRQYTHAGKTVYYGSTFYIYSAEGWDYINFPYTVLPNNYGAVAWAVVYGASVEEPVEQIVALFSINLGDAGGYPGGGGGWISPGDWNPDPTTTLHLTVNGALSGRHNDPLEDPSYSYIPADNTAQAGYGCGGDGGHGGGGGAGASTVIVRKFATNKANNKNIIALAKRHGYGSGGGKGATGGDGCILIYY